MKILVSGASGLIGSHLLPVLQSKGHQVFRLVRRPARNEREISYSPDEPLKMDGFDAVVHLAGETIMGRWSTKKKQRILESRVQGTRALATEAAASSERPEVFISASAVGYYGFDGDDLLTESSP